MSSDYYAICLSHTPALELGRGWDDNLGQDPDAAVGRALGIHPHCDIALGAYSYPLVRVACLGTLHPGSTCEHNTPEWADADWLRLILWARTNHPDGPAAVDRATRDTNRCWPPDRLDKLAALLNPGSTT